jgi:hypothetical protein
LALAALVVLLLHQTDHPEALQRLAHCYLLMAAVAVERH